MEPIEVIDRWIDSATRRNLDEHRKTFWLIRNALIGVSSKERIPPLLDFMTKNIKPCQESDLIKSDLMTRYGINT